MLKKLCEERNIPLIHFARMAHTSTKTMDKYDSGEKIQESSKRRIEIMIRVIEENNIVFMPHRSWTDYRTGKVFCDRMRKTKQCEYLARQNKDWVEPKR